jgi:glycosyltransferase involved in cell wall biosynthesis
MVGILSEGRDWRRLPGVLRQVHSQLNEGKYRRMVRFVLALGHLAAKWYEICGYSQEQVFPFCYVVESEAAMPRDHSNSSQVNLSFVGQLIERKRVDLLIRGLSKVKSENWHLHVIGDGKKRFALEKLVHDLHLSGMIDFAGVLENKMVRLKLADSDVFVLPSNWDGWGAVVNEALMTGVPVICSDFCGASDLIRPGFNGELFKCGSVDSLAAVLDKWISGGPLDLPARRKIQSWSRSIEGEAVARYFIQIIDYLEGTRSERPQAPWRSEDGYPC